MRPLHRHSDDRGHLVAVASGADVPFEIRRVFWIYGNAGSRPRAGHANSTTTELLVCVAGQCQVTIQVGTGAKETILNRPDTAILVPPKTWIELTHFSPDCVLLVLADTEYSEEDAITDRGIVEVAPAR